MSWVLSCVMYKYGMTYKSNKLETLPSGKIFFKDSR